GACPCDGARGRGGTRRYTCVGTLGIPSNSPRASHSGLASTHTEAGQLRSSYRQQSLLATKMRRPIDLVRAPELQLLAQGSSHLVDTPVGPSGIEPVFPASPTPSRVVSPANQVPNT